MPDKKKQGRPQLPPSTDQELNERRKYYREYNRRRRKALLGFIADCNRKSS